MGRSGRMDWRAWLALLALVMSMVACDGGNGSTATLNAVSQHRAWCGSSQADVCVEP